MDLVALLEKANLAKPSISTASTADKNKLLECMSVALTSHEDEILAANAIDLENSRGDINEVMLDRLSLDSGRIAAMADGIRAASMLPDPIGVVQDTVIRPNGLIIKKVTVPFGVVAVIYESRPNVTSDAAVLCLKAGNVCVLRGGKEAINSNVAIVNALKSGAVAAGFSADIISIITDTTRDSANALMRASKYVDLLIPRGGAGLIRACVDNATVPCIETGTGICHIFVDASADIDKAVNIVFNAKTSRPSVCNSAEVCLVHKDIADKFLPLLAEKVSEKSVELRLCPVSMEIVKGTAATDDDFDTEFLDYILAVKIVDNLDAAIVHISNHSTHHSDCIITEDIHASEKFIQLVDSAAVYVNASTRFTDGAEFGLGCEIGISTQKIGARGPMGLCEISTYKYVISGNGQIR